MSQATHAKEPAEGRHTAARGALAGAWLIAGLVAALVGTILVGMVPLPGGNVPPPPVAATVLALCALAAGWRFGRALARITRVPPPAARRLARAGALGYGAAVAAAGSLLGVAEPALSAMVERGAGPPMHVVFGALFTGATAIVALVTGAALGAAVGGARAALRLGLAAALAAASAFAAVDVLLDLVGARVGAPGAAERATMMTVMSAGLVGAACAIGAVLARQLDSIHTSDLAR